MEMITAEGVRLSKNLSEITQKHQGILLYDCTQWER